MHLREWPHRMSNKSMEAKRRSLTRTAAPPLEQGEELQVVFPAMRKLPGPIYVALASTAGLSLLAGGRTPVARVLTAVFIVASYLSVWISSRVIAVTDRSIVEFGAGGRRLLTPKRLIARHSRNHLLCSQKARGWKLRLGWRTVTLSDHPFDVSRAWFPDLDEADDLLRLRSAAVTSTAVAPDTPPAPSA